MGKTYDSLDDVAEFLKAQSMFFVATAPLSGDGLVNVSPKGLDSFRILDSHTVAYLDLIGSGAETIAHVRENGRLTLLFCAFAGRPNLVRLYGKARVVEQGEDGFEELAGNFPEYRSARSVIVLDCERIADSCGFGVPRMELVEQRDQLTKWAERKSDEQLHEYREKNNLESLDGLPALVSLPESSGGSQEPERR